MSHFLGTEIMLKNLAILWFISVTVLIMPNALLAVEEAAVITEAVEEAGVITEAVEEAGVITEAVEEAAVITEDADVVEGAVIQEISEAANLVDKDSVSGKEISYIQGYVKGIGSCCKWWHHCWYRCKAISNAGVELYIRTSNGQGGEQWIKVSDAQTDNNGYYSFAQIKNYCGPIQVKVPGLQHSPVVDYSRNCVLESGRELNIKGTYPCQKSSKEIPAQ